MHNFLKKHKNIFVIFILLLTITSIAAADELKVHYIDVGQGDSILIQAPENNDMLIDGGPRGAGDEVISYLQGQG